MLRPTRAGTAGFFGGPDYRLNDPMPLPYGRRAYNKGEKKMAPDFELEGDSL